MDLPVHSRRTFSEEAKFHSNQLLTLITKNLRIFSRKPIQTTILLLIPLFSVLPAVKDDLGHGPANTASPCLTSLRKYDNGFDEGMVWCFTGIPILFSYYFYQMMVDEKHAKLIGSLRRLGMHDWTYWLSWMITAFLFILPGTLFGVGVAYGLDSPFINNTDMGVFFFYFVFYMMALVANSCFLAAITVTPAMSSFLLFLSFMAQAFTTIFTTPRMGLYSIQEVKSGIFACVQDTTAFTNVYADDSINSFLRFITFWMPWFHGGRIITDILTRLQLVGFKFDMSYFGEAHDDYYTFDGEDYVHQDIPATSNALALLFANIVVYFVLAWVLGLVLPSPSGSRSLSSVLIPPYVQDYLREQKAKDTLLEGDIRGEEKKRSLEEKTIRLYKLSKSFKGTMALKEVALDMKLGEIFVLLGQNGSGKSTMINILTGLIEPTYGKAFVMGADVAEETSAVQKIVGVCPQDDFLWNELTAIEHMEIVARMRGLEVESSIRESMLEVLSMVGLEDRADSFAVNFSGGMKRRLTIAMSTVGAPPVIFFDEPTTGLDPLNRRRVWDMLNWLKTHNRIILLTTHNLEEADALGDTICFLHSGSVRALGDPLFLKERYGKGYQISITAPSSFSPYVQQTIETQLPGAKITRNTGSTEATLSTGSTTIDAFGNVASVEKTTFQLTKDLIKYLPSFFAWLKEHSVDEGALLGTDANKWITDWGMTNTTLEQIFLRLCVQNTQVNYVEESVVPTAQLVSQESNHLCPLCRVRTVEKAAIYSLSGKPFRLEDLICTVCASTPPDHTIVKELPLLDFSSFDIDPNFNEKNEKVDFDDSENNEEAKEHDKKRLISSSLPSGSEIELVDQHKDEEEVLLGDSTHGKTTATVDPLLNATTSESERRAGLTAHDRVQESTDAENLKNQMFAIYIKNLRLHGHQKKTNCCIFCYMLIMAVQGMIYGFYVDFTQNDDDSAYDDDSSSSSTTDDDFEVFDDEFDVTVEKTLYILLGIFILNAITIPFAMIVWRMGYEREKGITQMCNTIGIPSSVYILGTFLFDASIFFIVTIFMFAICMMLSIDGFGVDSIGLLLLFAIFNSMCLAAFAILYSRLFGKFRKIGATLSAIFIIASFVVFPAIYFFEYYQSYNLYPFFAEMYLWLNMLYHGDLNKNFSNTIGLMTVVIITSLVLEYYIEVFEMDLAKLQITIQTKIDTWLKGDYNKVSMMQEADLEAGLNVDGDIEDPDVLSESKYVHRLLKHVLESQHFQESMHVPLPTASETNRTASDHPILIQDLRHEYPGKKGEAHVLAVKNISLALKYGECFGLLGPNGSGKSTTISVLSGVNELIGGHVMLGGYDIGRTKVPIHRLVGVCPQHDVQWGELTVKEHLNFMARVKGYKGREIDARTQEIARRVGLDGDAYLKRSDELSGGMRRRLSIGMSLVGNPMILFLDEPTTGLDPDNRQQIWQIIEGAKNDQTLMVLTTHAMEEADQLCDRICILNQGMVKALGESTHLKRKFGKGYSMVVNFQNEELGDALDQFVIHELCSSDSRVVIDLAKPKKRKYILPRDAVSLPVIFQEMENRREEFSIREWEYSMVTLEEVYCRLLEKAEIEG